MVWNDLRSEFFGDELLPMGLPGAALPAATAVLAGYMTTRATQRLIDGLFPTDADGKPLAVRRLDARQLRRMDAASKLEVAYPMLASGLAQFMNLLPIPLLLALLGSPQAVSYALFPSLAATYALGEVRELPSVRRAVLGSRFGGMAAGPGAAGAPGPGPRAAAEVAEGLSPGWAAAAAGDADADGVYGRVRGLLGAHGAAAEEHRGEILAAAEALLDRLGAIERGGDAGPSAREALARAKVAALRGRLGEARERLERALEGGGLSDAHRHWALWNLGLVLAESGEPARSVEALSAALEARPGHAATAASLVRGLAACGRTADAQAALDRARGAEDPDGLIRAQDWSRLGLK